MGQPPSCPVKPSLAMKQIPNDLFFAWVDTEIAAGRSVQFRLKGISMFPLIRNVKDEVLLRPCSTEELRPMDVVLFKYRGKHLLHRIIRREGNRLLIQGDGSYVAQEQCTTDAVIGKVQAIVRPSGKVLPVESWQWRFPSWVWRHLGVFRTPLLRIFHRLIG